MAEQLPPGPANTTEAGASSAQSTQVRSSKVDVCSKEKVLVLVF
jgi:hypothetical protein